MGGNETSRLPTQVESKRTSTVGSSGPVPSIKAPSGYFTEDSYSMRNKTRGIVLIFHNFKFDPRRHGSDKDVARLYDIFTNLKFNVETRENKKAEEITNIVSEMAERDHSNFDCFIMCILSHGDENCINAYDGPITLDELSNPFKSDKCLSLAGKPKLFFIQACQGSKLDYGVNLVAESVVFDSVSFRRIPIEADFLFAYSTVSGYSSWRDPAEGTWFIQALCDELENNNGNDLLRVLESIGP